MNAPPGTAIIAREVVATAQPLLADDKDLLARATLMCPMEDT
ncbi:MAG TPA: hypothetical protein VNG12_26955 [Acidimicrobiales bacterium]|nr:hypothetical protein [Acidimicrobiales bacterium]